MKKVLIASASAIALLGLAACSENPDGTTTQSVPEPVETQPIAPAEPDAAPLDDQAPAENVSPAD